MCPTLNPLLTYFLSSVFGLWHLLMKQIKFGKIVIYLLPLRHSLGPSAVIFLDLGCHYKGCKCHVMCSGDDKFTWALSGNQAVVWSAHTHTLSRNSCTTSHMVHHLPLTCILHLPPPYGAADYKVTTDKTALCFHYSFSRKWKVKFLSFRWTTTAVCRYFHSTV